MTPRLIAPLAALAAIVTLAACSSSAGAHWVDPGKTTPATSSGSGSPAPAANGSVAITSPADGATDVPAGTQIAYSAADGSTATVALTDSSGKTIPGAAGYDPSTWVPTQELAYGQQYTAKVTATGTDGKTATKSITFTTMAAPAAANLVNVHSFLGDNTVYGEAVPIVLTFNRDIPSDDRAAVQKRLSVTTTPAQVGAWSWISPREVHWRPKAYWQPGTTFFANIQTGGAPMGDGFYGQDDLTISSSITKNPMSIIDDDRIHTLTVYINGKVVKRMPASLGKKSTPSSSGQLVIMSRNPSEEFDSSLGTGGIPVSAPGGYKELVYFTMRLTWDGQYIHAAPWSVSSQGHTDVSHGCTNVSTANAKWIYENSLVGTPVTVENTTRKVVAGDGWTDWNVTWDQYIKGSALPVSS